MLEPWEKFMLVSIFAVTFSLLLTGLIKYLPQHLQLMKRRSVYYLSGQEGDDEVVLWQWIDSGINAAKERLGFGTKPIMRGIHNNEL